MTALESWCLAMIGLVFQSLLAYVFVLLSLFREKSCQEKMISHFVFLFQVSPEKEKHVEAKRNLRLELVLFAWVICNPHD